MTDRNPFYYTYASFTNTQLPLVEVVALNFDRLIIINPVGATCDTGGADDHVRNQVRRVL